MAFERPIGDRAVHQPASAGPPTHDGDGRTPRPEPGLLGPSVVRRVLTARIPVWLLVLVTVATVICFGVMLFVSARSNVEIGPAVGAARDVSVRMTLCNADVDRIGLNPRTSELDLEALLRDQGADRADVAVERIDCPPAPSP